MTRNYVEQEKYISTEGIDNAMEVAKVLLKNGYEVMVELDDCNIYVVHFAEAKYKNYGNPAFYRIREEDIEEVFAKNEESTNEEEQ